MPKNKSIRPARSRSASDVSTLPFPPTPSASVAGATLKESTHKRRVEKSRLRPDAPNVLIILLDDVGFGLPDTFGGEVHTPTLTRLRYTGISYNAFHTTAICSPTRAALLTGRNHHRAGSGTIAERASDWDGYTGIIPRTSATIAEVLHWYGYKTCALGKWHNTPADQTTAMGPFDRWPTGHGFDYFYGFVAGETSQWEPRLYENTVPVEPPRDEHYHLSEDLAEKAIAWLRRHEAFTPDKPFFMYWAPGAAHGPHHIFKEWADKYKGKFDDGWDNYRKRVFARQKELGWIPAHAELTPRAETMEAWDDIPEEQRPFQRRLMEVFAGFCEHVDAQAGKVIAELERLGRLENTIVLYIWGDNGSSAEGQHGSIQADKTPRPQFHHVNDIGPTLYEAIGIKPPKVVEGFPQDTFDGVSMAYSFDDARAPGRKKTQYFENNGSRGIYHDGWYACTFGPLVPWDTAGSRFADWDPDNDVWELYHVTEDYTQAKNLAAKEPKRLAKLKKLFLEEAKKNRALPIGAGMWTRLHPEDRISSPYERWRFDSTITRMPEFTAPGLGRHSNRVIVDVEVGENASGVLYALGGASGGLTLFMDEGRLVYEYNMMIIERYQARSNEPLSAGMHRIEAVTTILERRPLSPAEVVLTVDGAEVARTTVGRTVPGAFSASETLGVGIDLGSPVSLDYFDRRPFAFNGKIFTVEVELTKGQGALRVA